MSTRKRWTATEYEYLEDAWGRFSLTAIAERLGRSPAAVKLKVVRNGLGAFLAAGDYITVHQLFLAIGKTGGDTYSMTSWVKNRGLPVYYKTVEHKRFKVIRLPEFWAWAEKNRAFIDWSKFEKNMLGQEPEWVGEQRRLKQLASITYKMTPWTPAEDQRLLSLLKQYKYGYLELSKMLRRTSGAIQRRICSLNIKERPLKADNMIKWTAAEKQKMTEMLRAGYDYELMARALGKSSKAIRGHVYNLYGSENLDKVRGILKREMREAV